MRLLREINTLGLDQQVAASKHRAGVGPSDNPARSHVSSSQIGSLAS